MASTAEERRKGAVVRRRRGVYTKLVVLSSLIAILSAGAGIVLAQAGLAFFLDRSLTEHLREEAWDFAAITATVFVVVVPATTLAVRRLLRPLELIEDAAHELGRGRLDARARVESGDEMANLAGVFNDMAGRLQESFRRIRRSEERYRNLVEWMHEGMLHSDASFRIIFTNLSFAKMLRYRSTEELIGMDILQAVPEARRAQLLEEMNKTRAGQSSLYETELLTRQGKAIPVFISATPLRDDEGNFQGSQAVIYDLSEIKRLQQETLKSERMASIGMLTSTVSHELRNPLAVIGASVHFLKYRLQGADDKVKEHLNILTRQVEAAAHIMDMLRDYARPQAPALQMTDLGALIEETILQTPPPPGVNVVRAGAGTVSAMADPVMMRQVFWNLVRNAYQAMPNGGALEIGVKQDGERVDVSFKDSGAGIKPEDMENLFNPLHSTKSTGFGLGLTISKRTVEKHGGQVVVESEPGKGTTFTVRLHGKTGPESHT